VFSQVRFAAYGALLATLIVAGFSLRHVITKAGKYDAEVTRRVQLEKDHAEYVRADNAADAARDKASQGYQHELATLRAAAARPVPAVRLCAQPATVAADYAPAQAIAAGPFATSAPADVFPAGTGTDTTVSRDIGPDLFRLMERADAVSAQLRAILQLEGN
jgi:IS5 family transposase